VAFAEATLCSSRDRLLPGVGSGWSLGAERHGPSARRAALPRSAPRPDRSLHAEAALSALPLALLRCMGSGSAARSMSQGPARSARSLMPRSIR
jgi:hypothetical protein